MIRSLLLIALALTATTPTARAQSTHARVASPLTALTQANANARRRPDAAAFTDATQIYDYAPGALYEVYGAPGFISTVLLEPGEAIVTVAAGDTTRWMVEQASGGDMETSRAMLLIKPTRADIRTNIVLVTDRRTYSIEAIAVPGQTYSAQTAWRYPMDANAELAGGPAAVRQLNFDYRIRTVRGFAPRWLPVRVYDDGAKTFIEFPPEMATNEAPPLFINESGQAALVNFRVAGNLYVVDRLFDIAELRLGAESPIVVRISRNAAPRPTAQRRRGHP
jgi:P-type conjugative transfer protein TrbG